MQDPACREKEDIRFLVTCLQIPPGWRNSSPSLLNFLIAEDYATLLTPEVL